MPRRGGAAEVVTIWWRDIPAQVNGQVGRDRHQIVLPPEFQRAIDRAKRKAGIRTAADDVAQWRRTSERCDGDVRRAAEDAVRKLTAAYPSDLLGRLAYAGGSAGDVAPAPADPGGLHALDELDVFVEVVEVDEGDEGDVFVEGDEGDELDPRPHQQQEAAP